MEPSKYEPGDEPDVCDVHGRQEPCELCQRELEEMYDEWTFDERKERS